MPLSGGQVTRLWPYGGPGEQYGTFSGKTSGATKSYTITFTRHAIYGGIGIPYGSFAGKTAGTPFNLSEATIALAGGLSITGNDFDVEVNWDFEPPLVLTLAGSLGITGSVDWGVVGSLARTLANDTLAATGTTTITGTAAKTLSNDTLSATGTVGSSGPEGTIVVTLSDATLSASGTIELVGTVNVTLQNDTSAISGSSSIAGTIVVTLNNDTSNISGLVGDPPVGAATRLPLTNAGSS